MKTFVYKFLYSLPIQLFLLHLRRYQVLLLFWVALFSTINGVFAKKFGAISLFLAPEYLGTVSFYSMFVLGIAFGMFTMSWQITTFILHSKRFKFLATTNHPFAKYCLNNSIIPLIFLIFFLIKCFYFQRFNELNSIINILNLEIGFLLGILLLFIISFTYFFNTSRSILRSIQQKMGGPRKILRQIMTKESQSDDFALKVDNYLNTFSRIRRARNVDHYDKHFLDSIFKRHHFATVVMILIAFIFLIVMSYLTSYPVFRIPAGASVLIFFSVLIGLSGAFSYILGRWMIPILVAFLILLNWAIKNNIIDTRSKAIGLDYQRKEERPEYSFEYLESLFTPALAKEDKQKTLQMLNHWKNKFPSQEKPKLVLINVSGGGSRSATWCMDVLQRADSLLHGRLMQHTVLITGASGGMIAATYFRELYWEKLQGKEIDPYDNHYVEDVSKDLLNAVFSSFATNDFFTPFQRFSLNENKYPKDRGYAFERQLNINLHQKLKKTLGDYKEAEAKAQIPMIIFSPTITADGRRLLISPLPVSYLTWPEYHLSNRNVRDIDGVDFCRYFALQHPQQLWITSAIRMSATFPYVLPNVYLPTHPIIDVMDAGLRDNYGKEISLRFAHVFRSWINANTSGVVLIQIRDNRKNETVQIEKQKGLIDMVLEPLFTMQHNWSAFQDFEQDDLVAYAAHFIDVPFHRIIFQYVPRKKNKAAALNWHLTQGEKLDITEALNNAANREAFQYLKEVMEK